SAFVYADCSRHKSKHEINYFGQRLNDVSLGHVRLVTQHMQGYINLKHAGHVGQQVAGDHPEEHSGMMFVKVVDFRLDVVDVLASFEYYPWTESQPGHLIEHP